MLPPLSQGEDGGSSAAVTGRAASPPESFNGSALEWVLRKADESLDEIEENPPEYAKVIYDLSTGPIGALFGCPSFLSCGCLWICCLPGDNGAAASFVEGLRRPSQLLQVPFSRC